MTRRELEQRLRSAIQIRRMHAESLGYVVELCGMPLGSHGWELRGAREIKRAMIAAIVARLMPGVE